MQGKIIKGIAGFYYVHVADIGHCADNRHCADNSHCAGDVHTSDNVQVLDNGCVYECKAKGVFRKEHQKPLVGDDVLLDVLDEDKKLGNIRQLLPRHSQLIRPAVANVDQALVIFSIVKPQPNFNLLDRFLIMIKQQNIPCIICFNKQDMDDAQKAGEYEQIYRDCGYDTLCVSAATKQGLEYLQTLLEGKTTTVAGPSGVGKSSIINCLQSGTVMETGSISEKIERGKHTTRHSELIAIRKNTYILDTPGFSSLGLFDIEKEALAGYYEEFNQYEKYCKFGGCSHITEPVCGIRDAVAEGHISRIRYDNYCQLYEELKNTRKYH